MSIHGLIRLICGVLKVRQCQRDLATKQDKLLAYSLLTGEDEGTSTLGEPAKLVPKEQPPRKLSGKRTDVDTKTLESGTQIVPAEGIAISGNRTEGASRVKAWLSRPSGAARYRDI